MREALRYSENAKETLKNAPTEYGTYTDIKYVQEACGTAYLAILKAVDEYLVKRGVDEKELPQSVEKYREMIRKYAMIHNGKLVKEFEKLYKALHIAGYYRGLLEDVAMVRDAFRAAKVFIDKIR